MEFICPHCNKPVQVPKCKDCMYLVGDKKSIGVACTNPKKQWSRSLSMYKQPCSPACSMFTPKEESNIIGIEVE